MASGMKGGKTVAIALDYQGNVVARVSAQDLGEMT